MVFWKNRKPRVVTGEAEAFSVVDRIALSDGRSAPADLYTLARRAFDSGQLQESFRLLCRVTDRNHDFASALPGMTGRNPLRAVMYNPLVTGLMVAVVERLAEADEVSTISSDLDRELHVLDNEWPRMFSMSNPHFWGLFLSDAAVLRELQLRSIRSGSLDETQKYLARFLVEHADRVQQSDLTAKGLQALDHLRLIAGLPQVGSVVTPRWDPPIDLSTLPCGNLITQPEIEGWVRAERATTGRGPSTWQPKHRKPTLRPSDVSAEQLQERAIWEGVSVAQGDPDGWWIALDLAIYRWELSDTFESAQFKLVSDVAYDLYAAKQRGEAPATKAWSWDSLLEMFEFVESRLQSQREASTSLPPLEFRELSSSILWFSSFRLNCLAAAGRASDWYALAPIVHRALAEANPQFLTAMQAHFVQNFEAILAAGPGAHPL